MNIGEMVFNLRTNAEQANRGIADVQGRLIGLTSTANLLRNALMTMAGGAGISEFVSKFADLEYAEVRLKNITHSMGAAAGFSSEQFREMTDSMMSYTTATRAQVAGAEFSLSKFSTQLRGNEFRRALNASQSLANLTGMDLEGAAELLGRTLEDPAAMLARFQRSTHLHLNMQQKKQIETLGESGQVVEAKSCR
jgi:hypothetical protein